MTFYIVEQDPLVRTDLRELLQEMFPGEAVHALESVQEMISSLSMARLEEMVVALIGAPINEAIALQEHLGATADKFRFIMMNDTPAHAAGQPASWPFVPRPFSGDMVISAIKSVLGHQPEVR
jgi:DNA-binding NarL/FixJ family response regulator